MNDKLEKINTILHNADLMGLIKIGAPPDEYNTIGQNIYDNLARNELIEVVQQKIWDAFYEDFCTGEMFVEDTGEMSDYADDLESAIMLIGSVEDYSTVAIDIKNIMDN